MVRGHGNSARCSQPHSPGINASHRCLPITPKPMPALPSLCCSSCWVLAWILAMWHSWASSNSCGRCLCPRGGPGCRLGSPCCTGGCNRQEGLDSTSHGAWGRREPSGCWCPPQGCGVRHTSVVSLLEVGSAMRSRALSRGVSTSPRGAPCARPGPRCPRTAGGSPGSTRRWRGSARSPCWDTPTSQRQMGRKGEKKNA